jgi:molybdate transport system substrate-binding protein
MDWTMNKPLVLLSLLMILALDACTLAGSGRRVNAEPQSTAVASLQPATLVSHLPAVRLTVFAAASLTDAFQAIGKDFQTAHPGVVVDFSFAGSQILRTQLEQGATADVVAFADQKNMDSLISDGLVSAGVPRDFATNQMVVILPPGNPGGLKSLIDLARPGLKLVLADASVPAGTYARQILEKLSNDPTFGADFSTQVMANVVSNETDVRQVVTKVELGEADAGIVYTSDLQASPDLLTIPILLQYNVTAQYPIAILRSSPNPELAAEFVSYVTSPEGGSILSDWGFSPAGVP